MQLFVTVKQLTVTEARERKGWKQNELAERAGLDKGTVSRIEAGEIVNPSNDTVKKLERALGVRPGTLVFGDQVMERAS